MANNLLSRNITLYIIADAPKRKYFIKYVATIIILFHKCYEVIMLDLSRT